MAGTFLEGGQDDEHAADVGNVRAGEDRVTGDADRVPHTLRLQSESGHAGDDFIASFQARAVRELGIHDQVALVLLRDEACGNSSETQKGQSDQAAVDQQNDHAHAQKQGYDVAVNVGRAVKDAVEA